MPFNFQANKTNNALFLGITVITIALVGLQRKTIQISEITMEVGGWVHVSLGFFYLENRPKIALNQYWSSIPCVFCLNILHC